MHIFCRLLLVFCTSAQQFSRLKSNWALQIVMAHRYKAHAYTYPGLLFLARFPLLPIPASSHVQNEAQCSSATRNELWANSALYCWRHYARNFCVNCVALWPFQKTDSFNQNRIVTVYIGLVRRNVCMYVVFDHYVVFTTFRCDKISVP